jgi:hypothetical protein
MIGYLIDPYERKVTEVELAVMEDGDVDIHALYEYMNCQMIEAIYPEYAKSDIIYLDEEGRLKPNMAWFCTLWPLEVLMGKAIWIGRKGECNASPKCTREYVASHIAWSKDER